MIGWHHQLNRHESEQTLGDSERQGDCIRIHEIHGFPLIACDPLCLQITDFVEQHQENLIMTGGKGLKMKKKVVSKG